MRYLSQGCKALIGYEAAELTQAQGEVSYDALTHPDDLERVLTTIQQAVDQGRSYEVEYRLRTRSGDYKWLWEKGLGICNAEGEVIGLEGFITDITPLKQTEETLRAVERALRSREAFLQMVLDSLPQPVFWKDRQSRYLGCNQAFATLMGMPSPAAIVGRTDHDLAALSPEDVAYYQACDRLVIERGQPDRHTLEPQAYADGRRGWVECSRLPLRNDQGDVIGVLAIFTDVTNTILAQQALKTRETYLATLSEIQRQLLAWSWDWADSTIQQVFAALGSLSGACRVYYYDLTQTTTGEAILRQRIEWSAPGIPSTVDLPAFQTLPVHPLFSDWYERLNQQQNINLTEDQFSDLQHQVLSNPPSNIRSLLLLPLLVQGELHGVMGFSNCQTPEPWGQMAVDLLQVVTADIALALERRQTSLSLQLAEAQYRSIVENAVEGIFQTTPEGRYRTVNPMLAKIYGYDSPADLMETLTAIGQQLYVDPRRRQTFIQQMASEKAVLGFESQVYRKDGEIIWISESARAIYDETNTLIGYEGTVEDITERKRGELDILRRDRLLQGVAQASHQLLTATDLSAVIPHVLAVLGEAAEADRAYIYEHHRQSEKEDLAMSMRYEWTRPGIAPSINQPHWQDQTYKALGVERWLRAFRQQHTIRGLVRDFPAVEQNLLSHDHILSLVMVPIFIDNDLWGYIGFDACRHEQDWTTNDESILVAVAASLGGLLKRQRTEALMYYQAYHDSLTGLPNRTFFNQHLPQALDRAKLNQQMLAVVFLDLDRFKTINDTLSHAVGDLLLQQVTQRIAKTLRSGDIVARWGGDEFTLILPHITCPDDGAKIAERIAQQLTTPFLLNGHELHITTSIGIALYPHDGEDMTTLLQNADVAMYRAKEQGRNNYQFYTQDLSAEASQRLQMESYLHQALERQEFVVYYQPQIDVMTGQVVQMEALLRWYHPKLGLLTPPRFVPLAEETGLIIPMGKWVLQTACQQVMQWQQDGYRDLRVAVNLSARQLQHPNLVEVVATVLQETGLPATALELEITETAAMADVEVSIQRLRHLRQLGVQISMDDFGTGYSCLSYLKQLPLDGLKIDRAFVKDLPHSVADQAMVNAILGMASGLGLGIVAEGVETLEQMNYLYENHCLKMQGFLFGRPQPPERATQYLSHCYTPAALTAGIPQAG